MEIQIKTRFTSWRTVSAETACKYIRHLMDNIVAIPREFRPAYIERNYLRGCTASDLIG